MLPACTPHVFRNPGPAVLRYGVRAVLSPRSPVYLLPAGRLRHGQDADIVARVYNVAAEVIASRPGARGIVHTVSHSRAKEFCRHLALYDPQSAMRLAGSLEDYCSREDAVLVTASHGTGHDFPDDLCRWQVVLKCPYPDLSDPLTMARQQESPEYVRGVAADALVQICGRNMRHEHDYGETFIVDSAACDLMTRDPELFPEWLRRRTRSIVSIPKPLEVA